MDTAIFAAPLPLRATARSRTPSMSLTTPATGRGARRRLLRALAGPANTAPFHQPRNARRHRPSPPSAAPPR
jgi:hypothetical protein